MKADVLSFLKMWWFFMLSFFKLGLLLTILKLPDISIGIIIMIVSSRLVRWSSSARCFLWLGPVFSSAAVRSAQGSHCLKCLSHLVFCARHIFLLISENLSGCENKRREWWTPVYWKQKTCTKSNIGSNQVGFQFLLQVLDIQNLWMHQSIESYLAEAEALEVTSLTRMKALRVFAIVSSSSSLILKFLCKFLFYFLQNL